MLTNVEELGGEAPNNLIYHTSAGSRLSRCEYDQRSSLKTPRRLPNDSGYPYLLRGYHIADMGKKGFLGICSRNTQRKKAEEWVYKAQFKCKDQCNPLGRETRLNGARAALA